MIDNVPKYLYHYTNINTLALILKNKTIKFSSLDKVDDLEESQTNDLGNFGKYCFVSCWTENEEESIPFWHMYTQNKEGVRIKLPSNPFKKYVIPKEITKTEDILTYFNPVNLLTNNYFIQPFLDILRKVEYTDDISLLYPKVYFRTKKSTELDVTNLGKYKRTYWSFQKEWRYWFFVFPGTIEDLKTKNPINKWIENKDLPFDDYYLSIDDEAFKRMEIILGPNTNEGHQIIVESLIDKYNQNAKALDSSLKGKIR